MKLLKKGEVIGDFIGARPKSMFKKELEEKI
jgi:hypothetical protein